MTTPHAWRTAFSRVFPGSDALGDAASRPRRPDGGLVGPLPTNRGSETRRFTRLTALASWRSEYIIRTRLLRSLARGKPAHTSEVPRPPAGSRSSLDIGGQSAVTYTSGLHTPVTHLHASFEPIKGKKVPRFILGTEEIGWARRTDVSCGKVDGWGSSDPQSFLQFEERFPGDALWGLGAGTVAGVPNVMDLSQPYGMVYGEGSPGGLVYLRCTDEMRGRFLAFSKGEPALHLGIPEIQGTTESVCSVWIAKSANVVSATGGLVGILSGSSYGVVTAYSLGTNGLRNQRLGRGEVTARWVVSPGVPIIAIAVDDSYSLGRQMEHRGWVAVLNALGEVYYLTELPKRWMSDKGPQLDEVELARLPWKTGRTVRWHLVEPTRRTARPDPYNESGDQDTYSPRSSWDGMCFGEEQLAAETKGIQKFLGYSPNHFRTVCDGWNMRRRFEVDFTGGGHDTQESIVVINCGRESGEATMIERYIRCRNKNATLPSDREESIEFSAQGLPAPSTQTVFPESDLATGDESPGALGTDIPPLEGLCSLADSTNVGSACGEWRTSELSFGAMKAQEITATCIDKSTYALLTASEDPLLARSASTSTSSPLASPDQQQPHASGMVMIPGQRARLFAVGTRSGAIILWDVRGAEPSNAELTNILTPVRVIYTDSPQISCIALTALYIVHGGNDGLVQAWDPLASSDQPIRTLNSRFSSRARRRLLQGQVAANQEVGVNMYAAGAIYLDPDPTVLRGMVSLGAHLRYWSYNSSAASQYASRKRRLRRSDRHSNATGEQRFSGTGRAVLKDYITNERLELERERDRGRKEADRLAGRFGVGLLGREANEAEMLAYAKLLSEESFVQDDEKRRSETDSISGDSALVSTSSSSTGETIAPDGDIVSPSDSTRPDGYFDEDIVEALHRSLADSEQSSHTSSGSQLRAIPIRYVKRKQRSPVSVSSRSSSSSSLMSMSSAAPRSRAGPSSSAGLAYVADDGDDDLDFAIQLSLAEEQSRKVANETGVGVEREDKKEEFPALSSLGKESIGSRAVTARRSDKGKEKGKGKMRAS